METFNVTKVSNIFFCFRSFFVSPHFVFALPLGSTLLFMTEQPKGKKNFQKIFRYFIQGLIILAPIAITGYALYWLFDKVDSILRPYVSIPGLGFVIIMLFVILVGWISSYFFMGSFIHFFDQWMERTPGVKFIYSSTKDFFEAFAGDKRKFNKSVLANVFSEDVWIVGFLTDEEMKKFDMGSDKVSVYVPQAYNFAGQLYILPRHKVRKIEKITAGEAMKYAVTGGVVDLDAERVEETVNKKEKEIQQVELNS